MYFTAPQIRIQSVLETVIFFALPCIIDIYHRRCNFITPIKHCLIFNKNIERKMKESILTSYMHTMYLFNHICTGMFLFEV